METIQQMRTVTVTMGTLTLTTDIQNTLLPGGPLLLLVVAEEVAILSGMVTGCALDVSFYFVAVHFNIVAD